MSEERNIDYHIQFNVVRREGPQHLEVIFHGPGRIGFNSREAAERAISELKRVGLTEDVEDMYVVVPVLVASDFDPHFELVSEEDSEDTERDIMALPAIQFPTN